MKKMFLRSAVVALAGVGLMAGYTLAAPVSADYWTLTDFTTGTNGESTMLTVDVGDNFNGSFGLYTVDDVTNPTTIVSEFEVFDYNNVGWLGTQSVYFNTTATGWQVSLDDDWGDGDDQDFDTTFGFYFTDLASSTTYYTDQQFNPGQSEYVFTDLLLPTVVKIGLDTDGDGSWDPTVVATDVAPVPEPATMLLFGTGLAGLAGVVRRKKVK